jgi:hypothetical protein
MAIDNRNTPQGGISIREFARREGVSDTLVRRALQQRRLVANDDGTLDPALVGSAWCARNANGAHSKTRDVRSVLVVHENETPARAANRLLEDGAVELLDYSEALRLKENYLALLRRLEFEARSGELIELAVAEAVVFDIFRAQRNAWLSWPTKAAPLIADALGLTDIGRVAAVLAEHVHTLVELGEPPADTFDAER